MAWSSPRTWVAGELVTAAMMNGHVRDQLNILKVPLNDTGHLSVVDESELTIASGAITVTQNYHRVDTQSDASTDDLDTITAGTNVVAGHLLIVKAEHTDRDVVLKHNTGNLKLSQGADVTLDDTDAAVTLLYDGTNWTELARSAETDTGSATVLQVLQGETSTEVSTTGSSYVDSGLSVTITVVAGSDVVIDFSQYFSRSGAGIGDLQLVRDSTELALVMADTAPFNSFVSGHYLDASPGAGTYTYKTRFRLNSGGGTFFTQEADERRSSMRCMELAV